MLWWPLIPTQERVYIGDYRESFIVCIAITRKSESCLDWFSKILGMVDWKTILSKEAEYDNSVSGLQHLSRELNRSLSLQEKAGLDPDLSTEGFSEFLHSIAEHSKSPNGRVVDTDVLLLTPRVVGMKGTLRFFLSWMSNHGR